MTDAEFDRSMAPFAPLIERGYQATLTLNRLAGDEGFRQRYLKGDAEAVELFNRLTEMKAAGTQPYHDAKNDSLVQGPTTLRIATSYPTNRSSWLSKPVRILGLVCKFCNLPFHGCHSLPQIQLSAQGFE